MHSKGGIFFIYLIYQSCTVMPELYAIRKEFAFHAEEKIHVNFNLNLLGYTP